MEAAGSKGSSSSLAPPAPAQAPAPTEATAAASSTPAGSKTTLAAQKSATQVAASPAASAAVASPVQGILVREPPPLTVEGDKDQKTPVTPGAAGATAATSGRLTVSQAAAAVVKGSAGRPTVPELSLAAAETQQSAGSGVEGPKDSRLMSIGVEEQLTTDRLRKFRRYFNEADTDSGGTISIAEFRVALRKTVGSHVTDEEADMIFMKVDTNCDGTIDWEEYLSYVLLECRERDLMKLMAQEPYVPEPRFCKADNRDIIVSLQFLPSPSGGRYLSVSKEGLLTFWSKNFTMPSSQRVVKGVVGTTPIWITAVEIAQKSRLIIVGTTSCDLTFYFYGTNTVDRISRIHQLPGCVMSMHFYSESHHQGTNRISFLTWGDEFGGLGLIIFSHDPLRTDVGNPNQTDVEKKKKIPRRTRYFFFTDISNGVVKGLGARYRADIHAKYVRQVRYFHKMRCWLSCAKDTATAFFFGDLLHLPAARVQYWPVEHGVNSFDYCEKLNVIVTGGSDTVIRLWNPLAESKLVGFLKGHISPITHLLVNGKLELVISLGENKDIIVFDLSSTTAIQKVLRKTFRPLGIRPFSAALLHPQTYELIVATKLAAFFSSRTEENVRSSMVAKNQLVTVILYNELFKQVVSADQLSQVCVYDIFNGQKIMQFTVHTTVENGRTIEVEITAMCFDSTHRRLATGTLDGVIKLWNYNNGTLLQRLDAPDKMEITCIAWPPNRLLASGWSRRLIVYLEVSGNKDFRCLNPEHSEDVLCLGVYPPRMAISASEDGSVMVWSLETSYPLFMFSTLHPNEVASANFYESISAKVPGQRLSEAVKGYRISSARQSEVHYWAAKRGGKRGGERKTPKPRAIESSETRLGGGGGGLDAASNASLRSPPPPPPPPINTTNVAVEVLIVLSNREIADDAAVLLTCLTNGHVLAWPLNIKSHCVGEFFAASAEGESINCASVTQDNEFLVTGDSAGYLRVFDISHYRRGAQGPQCDAETDAEREPVWNAFPFVRMRRVTDQLKLTKRPGMPLHFRCKCTATDPGPSEAIADNPPHLVNNFYGHLGNIIGVQITEVYGRVVIVSAATDFSVRLWSIYGEFLGMFGQRDKWRNLRALPELKRTAPDPDAGSNASLASEQGSNASLRQEDSSYRSVRKSPKIGLPHDLRRVASYTTMFVLETEADTRRKSKWGAVRNATAWILTFLANRDEPTGKVFELPGGSAEKAAAFSSNLREMIEEHERGQNMFTGRVRHLKQVLKTQTTDKDAHLFRPIPPQTSSILGTSYKRLTRHRPITNFDLDESVGGEVSPYRALPCIKLDEHPEAQMLESPLLMRIKETHTLAPFDPTVGLNLDRKESDPTIRLMNALRRAGWTIGADGMLHRQRLPINGPFRKSMLLIPSLRLVSEEELRRQSYKARKSSRLQGMKRSRQTSE